ncbi:DoxX family protein [Arcticibacter eurypsychrophilus]|uniref:DoxX family protein n=1 Tax=Arcticibacter eurypsychrophilus TaxID=1434752 RepID=UPI00084E0457|nr:DoxX family protein [Arcticibacter eurypsychrophilus]
MKSPLLKSNDISIDFGLLLLRLTSGGSLLSHGWTKLQKALQGVTEFADPIGIGPEISLYLAIFAEFFCALLIIIGFAHRLALIPLIITMLVAFFVVHATDPFGTKELAFLFLSIFVTLFFTGPGKYAIDRLFK